MGKALLVAAFAILAFLAFGTENASDNSMFWLASSAIEYHVVRFGLMLLLILQIATNPPRHRVFRAISMIVATTVSAWTLSATYNNHMLFLDSLSLLASATAIAITALERKGAIFAKATGTIKATA